MRIQSGMQKPPYMAAVRTVPFTEDGMGKEQEICGMTGTNRRKAVCVVRARQERTGILYTDRRLIQKPEDALAAFGRLFDRAGVEMLYAAALTKRGEPVAVQLIAVGGVDSCMVSVPEILKLALLSNCPSFLLIHNHPSGDSSPSEEDRAITERVEKAAEIVGIRMVEHLIVGDMRNGYSIKYEQKVHLPEADPEKAGEIRNGIRGTDSGQAGRAKQNACREKKGA